MINNRKFGVALSGGGLRAAAFHLGTLRSLNKLGILEKVDVISTISGGSILGAAYVLSNNFSEFEENFVELLKTNLLYRIVFSFNFLFRTMLILLPTFFMIFVHSHWAVDAIVFLVTIIFSVLFLYKLYPTTDMIRNQYSEILYGDKKVVDFPDVPMIVINATNLETGTLMSFTKTSIYDSSYSYRGETKKELSPSSVSIAKAVSASTAFPYFFHPVTFDKIEFVNPEDYDKVNICLADGGLYDNQGIYRLVSPTSLTKSDIVIVSDAAAPFKKRIYTTNPLPVLKRIMDILMKRIRSIQFVNSIYQSSESEIFEIGYFSLDWQYSKCIDGFVEAVKKKNLRDHLYEMHDIVDVDISESYTLSDHIKMKIGFESIIKSGLTKEEIVELSEINTSLNALTEDQINNLIKHSEILCEIQVKLYCPTLKT